MYETATVLSLGARGRDFTLVGRTCVRGRRGAIWNEWTARFDDGQTRFLVETGDELAFYDEVPALPDFEATALGESLDRGFFTIARAEATRVERWGDVDEAPRTYRHVDLARTDGARATIDYGGAPRLFLGRTTTLTELGLAPLPRRTFVPAPDVSRPLGVDVWLAPGDEGMLDGAAFVVIGMLSRRTDEECWDEVALFSPTEGLRWLVLAGGRFRLARATPVTDPRRGPGRAAEVVWATGELPWAVAIGDTSFVEDDGDLSKEWTADEITWSRSHPVATDVIAKGFRKRALPKPDQ